MAPYSYRIPLVPLMLMLLALLPTLPRSSAESDSAEVAAVPAPSPSNEYSVEDLDLLKSTFFCGISIEEIDKDCENAIPCPSGDECPEGFGCFAFSQCGGVDISSLVDTFGDTDQPTRAPTVPIEQICDEEMKMSVNVGYWQSWSI